MGCGVTNYNLDFGDLTVHIAVKGQGLPECQKIRGEEKAMIEVTNVDHLGIRVTNETGSIAFYEQLGFKVERRADGDTVTILRNSHGIELNLVYNGVDLTGGKNILMDVPEKHTGYTHMALNVGSISKALYALREQNIAISQGPVSFGRSDTASVFIRDPDRNVIELRGNIAPGEQIEGLERYDPDA